MLILGHLVSSGNLVQGYDFNSDYVILEGNVMTVVRRRIKPGVRGQLSSYSHEDELRLKQELTNVNLKRSEAVHVNQSLKGSLQILWNNVCSTPNYVNRILEKQKSYEGETQFPDFHPDNSDEQNSFLWAAWQLKEEYYQNNGYEDIPSYNRENQRLLKELQELYQTSSDPEVQDSGAYEWHGTKRQIENGNKLSEFNEVYPTPPCNVATEAQLRTYLCLIDPDSDEKMVNETFQKNADPKIDFKYHHTTYGFTHNPLVTVEQALRAIK